MDACVPAPALLTNQMSFHIPLKRPGTAITRATGNLDWTIEANGTVLADTSFTMSAGETVRIRANYSPENASLDFGLVDSNEKFHYINVTTGSIDQDD